MFKLLRKIKDYLLLKRSGLFDEEYYCLQYPDVRRADVNPLWHFVSCGWKEGRNPSTNFDTSYYLHINNDVYVAAINPLIHYYRFGLGEGRSPKQNELKIIQSIPAIESVQDLPKIPTDLSSNALIDNTLREKNLKKFFFFQQINYPYIRNIKYIFFLPLFSTGGAELVAMNFINLILQRMNHISVLMIITDMEKMRLSFPLPKNLMMINLDNDFSIHSWEEKKLFVFDLICSLQPYAIHNINSSVFWNVLIERGDKIKKFSKVFSNIFCFQFDEKGKRDGYAEHYLRQALPYLDALLSDNNRFLEEAKKVYNLYSVSEKFYTIYNPFSNFINPDLPLPPQFEYQGSIKTQLNRPLNCLWAARLDEQKRLNFFFDIVKECNFCNFDMFGQAVVGTNPNIPILPNLTYHGGYNSFGELVTHKNYDAFVFTTKYEGLPNTLIEAGAWGLPIVAPNVGGIGELVNDKTGYLLREDSSVEDYIQALKEIEKNPEQAKAKVVAMRKLIAERHSWKEFSKNVSMIPGYLNQTE